MSKNLDRAIKAWESGKPYGKHPDDQTEREGMHGWGPRNPCWTDGRILYSYAMPIAKRDDTGHVWVADRKDAKRPDGGGRGGISMTTRGHIDQVNWHLRENSIEGVAQDILYHAAE